MQLALSVLREKAQEEIAIDNGVGLIDAGQGLEESEDLREQPEKAKPEYLPERRLFKVLLLLALLSLVASTAVNWGLGPLELSLPGSAKIPVRSRAGVPPPFIAPSVDDLPPTIPGFEAIDQHVVPGTNRRSVEALYVTLNMSLEAQISIAVYARVDGHASPAEAERGVGQAMRTFGRRRATMTLPGSVRGLSGYTANEGAYAIAWSHGAKVFFVKATFRDHIPAQKKKFLESQARPAAEAIQKYARGDKHKIKV